jgi:phosphocarrier protein HPr
MKAVRTVEIINERGLHARASAKFVKLAVAGDRHLGVEAAGIGSTIEISAEGTEAQPAVDALVGLVENRFDEER